MKSILIVSAFAVLMTSAQAKMTICFDTTANAAIEAVQIKLGKDADRSEIKVFDVNDTGSWTNGQDGPYNGLDFNIRSASVLANIDREVRIFTVTIDSKAGTCETLWTKVEKIGGYFQK